MCIAQKERERRREGERKKWKFPNCSYSYFVHLTPLPLEISFARDSCCLASLFPIVHCLFLSLSCHRFVLLGAIQLQASRTSTWSTSMSLPMLLALFPLFLFDKVLFFALFSKSLICVSPSSLLCIFEVNLRVQLCCHCSFFLFVALSL